MNHSTSYGKVFIPDNEYLERVQRAAATGRPLCAPSTIRDITQKTNRERNVR